MSDGEAAPVRTIPQMLRTSVARWPDAEAVVDGDVTLTYRGLAAGVVEAARGYLALGLRRGDRIGIWAPNTSRWIIASLGASSVGVAVVPLNTRYRGREVAEFLDRTEARGVLVEQGFLGYDHLGSLVAEKVPSLEFAVDLGSDEAPAADGLATHGWAGFLAAGRAVPDETLAAAVDAVEPSDLSEIIFTSGTTGRAKGVMLTHGPGLELYDDYGRIWGLGEGDRYLVSLPFFHTGGNKAGMIVSLMKGATIVPAATFETVAVFEAVQAQRITVMNAPPTVFQSMLDHPDRERYDLSSLRIAATGAAVVPVLMVRRARAELPFRNFITAYGLTETNGTVTMCRDTDDPETVANTNGAAVPRLELKIVDPAGAEVPIGEPGEVIVRGPNVTPGYWRDEEATAAAIVDGWLHTGDIGTVDAAGNLKVTDRLKDLFIVGGFNVSPAEVEQVIASHPDISEAAVIGVPDERLGEVARAYVIPKPGHSVEPDALIAWCRETMANFKVPRTIEIVETFPRNASGKVLRRELRAAASDTAPTPAGSDKGKDKGKDKDKDKGKDPTYGRITDAGIARLRSRIGVPVTNPAPAQYRYPNLDAFRITAEAYGDANPLWSDPDHAAGTVWGEPIAPPSLVGGDSLIGANDPFTLTDEQKSLMKGDPLRGVHAFYSGCRREWWRPLTSGQTIRRRDTLVGVLDKASEFAGRAIHEWSGQLFATADGAPLAGQYKLMIRTEREKARQKKKYAAIEPYVYTDAEIDDIERAVLSHQPRGAEPRYFEDVSVGDVLGPVVKGPLRVTDIVCWHVGMGMGLYNVRALELSARNRQRVPGFYHRDELNVWDVMQRVHWDPEFARRSGNPTTFDYGRMRETWFIHACTNWMGDDAWLWRLDCSFRKFNYVGDTQWITGTVTDKYLADGRPAIDLTLTAVSQRGEQTTTGGATILLPSREHGAVLLPDPPAATLEGAVDAVIAQFAS